MEFYRKTVSIFLNNFKPQSFDNNLGCRIFSDALTRAEYACSQSIIEKLELSVNLFKISNNTLFVY